MSNNPPTMNPMPLLAWMFVNKVKSVTLDKLLQHPADHLYHHKVIKCSDKVPRNKMGREWDLEYYPALTLRLFAKHSFLSILLSGKRVY